MINEEKDERRDISEGENGRRVDGTRETFLGERSDLRLGRAKVNICKKIDSRKQNKDNGERRQAKKSSNKFLGPTKWKIKTSQLKLNNFHSLHEIILTEALLPDFKCCQMKCLHTIRFKFRQLPFMFLENEL